MESHKAPWVDMLRLSFTLTLDPTAICFLLGLTIASLALYIRYRILNRYTRLKKAPLHSDTSNELYTEPQILESKPVAKDHLDDFLEAFRIFGYLERHVFQELTQSVKSRKLLAGQTLHLEEEKGFCVVVEGHVQIFVKDDRMNADAIRHIQTEDETSGALPQFNPNQEGLNQGYQLLTEVSNGSPMSSFFSILALFTEGVKFSRPKSDGRTAHLRSISANETQDSSQSLQRYTATVLPSTSVEWPSRTPRPRTPLCSENRGGSKSRQARVSQEDGSLLRPSAHPNIVARATKDTTIAVIPASAFHRLTRTSPKAAAHIVQLILTRFQRVTLGSADTYLGLSSEILRLERLMNSYTSTDLPPAFSNGYITQLKHVSAEICHSMTQEDLKRGVSLRFHQRSPKPATGADNCSSPSYNGHSGDSEISNALSDRHKQHEDGTSKHQLNSMPGIATDFQFVSTRTLPQRPKGTSPINCGLSAEVDVSYSILEDACWAVLQQILRIIGFSENSGTISQQVLSADQSPRLSSTDNFAERPAYVDPLSFMSPLLDDLAESDSDCAKSFAAGAILDTSEIMDELKGKIDIVHFRADSIIVEQGERNPGLFYVIDGFLEGSTTKATTSGQGREIFATDDLKSLRLDKQIPSVSQMKPEPMADFNEYYDGHDSAGKSFMIKPGSVIGYIGSVSSFRSFVTARAKTNVVMGFLPHSAVELLVEKSPLVILSLAKRITNLLPRLILNIDFALGWVQVESGQIVHHQGAESDAIYILLNGRLRSTERVMGGGSDICAEYGQGESIGELEVLTETERPTTVHAIRDAELVKIPKSLFNHLALVHPGIPIKIAKIIAARARSANNEQSIGFGVDHKVKRKPTAHSIADLRTIAIVPVSLDVPIVDFSSRLLLAISRSKIPKGVISLDQANILEHLGRHAFSRMGKLKLSQYLADLEERHGMLLYVADTNASSPWTTTCLTQADCVLFIGLAGSSSRLGEFERLLLTIKSTARKALVLLHQERFCPPGVTRRWLQYRPWINGGCFHVQLDPATSGGMGETATLSNRRRFGANLKRRVQDLQAGLQRYTGRRRQQTNLPITKSSPKNDIVRLARRLCGRSIGLVLGGGGARGLAQVGIIRALEEAGIPIDIVGGTSIGAFVGALYARDADVVPIYGRVKKFAGRMASMWRFALDLTYPSASYTTGHEFNRGIFKTFGDSQIEDFWLEYYCNTTNLSKSRMDIHRSGYAWRYVRASMSLAGLIPPLCDEGSMLLDGGYIDNLTVEYMRSLGARLIFAIDVGALDDSVPQAFGDTLSGTWSLINRWNPFSDQPNPPTLSEIQARLAYVSSVDALERAKKSPGCIYMRPPIDKYGTLDFGNFDEIYRCGYDYGRTFLKNAKSIDALHEILEPAIDKPSEGTPTKRGPPERLDSLPRERRASI